MRLGTAPVAAIGECTDEAEALDEEADEDDAEALGETRFCWALGGVVEIGDVGELEGLDSVGEGVGKTLISSG